MRKLILSLLLLALSASFADASGMVIMRMGAGGGTEWSKVAESSAVIDNNTGDQTVDLPGTPAAGDLVLIAIAADGTCANIVTTAGYEIPENAPLIGNPGSVFAYKVMGGTPDTSVDIGMNTGFKRAMALQVWRGVDTSTPLDNAWVTATNTGTSPDPPSTTTVNASALVVAVAYVDDDDATVSAWPTGYTNGVEGNTGQASGSVGATVAISSKVVSSPGAEDPAAYTVGDDVWQAGTISFKKASP